jgi:anti-anti-sigma factor
VATVDLIEGKVSISGEIDAGSCVPMASEVSKFRRDDGKILLDLSGVTFIDSRGVQALDRLRRTVPFDITAVSANVERILQVMGMTFLSKAPEPEPAA